MRRPSDLPGPGRVLVTGATGFVGRSVVEALIEDGHALTLAVRARSRCSAHWIEGGPLRIVETGDLETAAQTLDDAFSEVRAIVHLAGLAHSGTRGAGGERRLHEANVLATRRLVEAAKMRGIATFVFVSSLLAVCGSASKTIVDDRCQAAPQSAYGRSKRTAETEVAKLAEAGAFAVSLRPPLVVDGDAGANWHALQRLAASGFPLPFATTGNRRSVIARQSLSKAVAHLCGREWPGSLSGQYCIADHGILSLGEIVARLREGMGLSPRLLPCPPRALRGAVRLLGGRQASDSLLGDLEADPRRFEKAFAFSGLQDAARSVRESGAAYRNRTSGGSGDPQEWRREPR